MATTSIFLNNNTQSVRLPKDFSFPEGTKRVNIRRVGNEIILSPVGSSWDSFFLSDEKVTDDFLKDRHLIDVERELLDD